MRATTVLLVLGLASAPLAGQADGRADALTSALEHALTEYLPETPRSGILLDTIRTAADAPNHTQLVTRVVRELGLMPGISEDHCRRILVDHYWSPVGYQVHGVEAIARASFMTFTPDTAEIMVSLVTGSGANLWGPSRFILRRDSAGWHVTRHLKTSHGRCNHRLFPVPVALAARAMLDDLQAGGPTCLNPVAFPLSELDSVATILGAEIRGQYLPVPSSGELPERYGRPCASADTEWGGVLKILNVEWESDDLIHVTLEGRRMDSARSTVASERQIRYTVRNTHGGWIISEKGIPEEQGGAGAVR